MQILHALEMQYLPAGCLNAGFSCWGGGESCLLARLQNMHAGCTAATCPARVLKSAVEQSKMDGAHRPMNLAFYSGSTAD